MAVLQPYPVKCSCNSSFVALMADSVNAGRSPEVRQQILAGRFHRFTCPGCGREMTIEKEFSYTDFSRNTFIRVLPRQDRHLWGEISQSLGRQTRRLPRDLSRLDGRILRVAFGIGELREKLVAQDAGIDDRLVELLKVLLVHEHPILLKRSRLRLQLNEINDERFDFAASYDHENQTFRVGFPRWLADQVLENHVELERWVTERHGQASLFGLGNDRWVNMWRWSPQPSALENLRRYAEEVRQGGAIDTDSQDFRLMLDHLPRGTHLPSWAKRDLHDLSQYARGNQLPQIEDALFEIRFGIGLEDDWALNNDPNDIATIWKLLKDLPDTHVEGNAYINEISLAEGEGGGWYEPWSHDIYIGSAELSNRERFEDVLRHEVGHAVHEKFVSAVNPWLETQFGWRIFGTSNAEIDEWVGLMGGWGNLNNLQRAQVRGYLIQALGHGSSWSPGPAPNPPADHPWWRTDFAPRLAYEKTGGSWYANTANWFRVNGKAFFLNFWYRTLMAVDETALDLVGQMPSNYAAMSHFEFFAELYALYYDLDDPLRPNVPAPVAGWLDQNIGPPEPGAPMPAAPAQPESLPVWHWIRRPT